MERAFAAGPSSRLRILEHRNPGSAIMRTRSDTTRRSSIALALGAFQLGRRLSGASRAAPFARSDWPWLAGAIGAGGVVGPVLLMWGLAGGGASEAALLLNLEGVFTALLAWCVFSEHFDRRIALGMAAITGGALGLAWDGTGVRLGSPALLVPGACAAWALD